FYRDIMHMLMNALMYNGEDTEVYQMTMEMIPDAQACIEQLLQAEAAVNQPKTSSGANGEYENDDNDTPLILPVPGGDDNVGGGGSSSSKAEEAVAAATLLHDAGDSDSSSIPTKRRRRVASERASKHLRA
ncbi:hypothetical protein GGI21_006074, partial [Coemansia aciculifera]